MLLAERQEAPDPAEIGRRLDLAQFAWEHSPDAVFWMQLDGRLVYVNEVACRSLGFSREELLEMSISDIDPDATSETLREQRSLSSDGGSYTVETRHRSRDGRIFPVKATFGFMDVAGEQLACAFVRDISERRWAEAALRQSEERFRLACRASSDALYDLDLTGGATWISERHDRLFGPVDDDGAEWWISRIHPKDRDRVVSSLTSALGDGSDYWTEEYSLRLVSGAYGRVVSRAVIERGESGRATRVIGAVEDVTELRQAQAAAQRSERLAFLGTLGAGLAHELNNPLASVLMGAERALELEGDPDGGAARRECLEDVVAGALRSSAVVGSVLGFARRERTEKWPCHPNRVVRSAVASFQKWSAEPHASLDLELAEDLSEVTLSPLFIEQALVNLLRNAAQAGGPEARLRVRTRLAAGELRFEVAEDGPGAPKGNHARALEPFFTIWAGEGAAGSGLSLVDTIMADHGGRVDVEGGPGHGTIVALCIPLELGNVES